MVGANSSMFLPRDQPGKWKNIKENYLGGKEFIWFSKY